MSVMPRWLCVMAILVPGLAGCASGLPKHPWQGENEARRILADRSQRISTITAEAAITLDSAEGESIQLEAAIAAQMPDHLRLRAWKFGRAVLDVTVRPDGVWTWSAEEAPLDSLISENRLMRALGFEHDIFSDPRTVIDRPDEDTLLFRHDHDDGSVVARVDRDTLTVSEWVFIDTNGTLRGRVAMDRYAMITDIPWPMRLQATSDSGRVQIQLRQVQLNEPLSGSAFEPPTRAVRQQ